MPSSEGCSASPLQHSAALQKYPETHPDTPMSQAEHRRHQRLAREEQQMIEQLISAGLVRVEDLVAFGFTEAEVSAAGFHLALPYRSEEVEEDEAMPVVATDERRKKACKRGWGDADEANACAPLNTSVSSHAGAPRTAAKVVGGAPTSATAAAPCTHRGQDNFVRLLRHDGPEDRKEAVRTYAALPDSGAAARVVRTVNTALRFSGLDVAVAKEIALLLQIPADAEAKAEQLRMQEYLESRENGSTPYM